MNVEKLYDLRKEFDAVCEMCDKLEQDGCWPLAEQIPMKECLRLELANYCIYLTAADDVVKIAEALFFKVALGFEVSVDEINEELNGSNLFSSDFKEKVPVVISEIKGVQNAEGNAHRIGGMIADLFYKMGECIIECDGEVTADEKKDLSSYTETIKNFLK